jgi:YhcH/YjgK/YiaL family protein
VIFDRLATADRYAALGPRFAAGFAYLRGADLAALADGRYPIEGDNLLAIVQTYQTRPVELGRWEAHRHHADIQYIITGREKMGVVPIADVKPQPPYDPEKDVEFYAPPTGPAAQFLTVARAAFAVFFPHDVHMPNLQLNAPTEVKKVVIKVRL